MRRGAGADVDELHHRIGPHQLAVDRVLIREHPLRQALADDDDRLGVAAVAVGEVAAGDDRHAERGEESRRHRAEPRARILFAVRLGVALDGELEARPEAAGIAPRHQRADGDALDAGQLADAAHHFLVEPGDLVWRAAVRHHRHVQRQHVAHVEAGRRALQRDQRRQQHAGAGKQDERRGDLRDREQPQPAVRAGRDPDAAARQPEAVASRPPTAAAARRRGEPPRRARARRRPTSSVASTVRSSARTENRAA